MKGDWRRWILVAAAVVPALVVACTSGSDSRNRDPEPEETPEICGNSADDDGDGGTDCDDSDCAGTADCRADGEDCDNGTDDDGDGNADCADTDCTANAACVCIDAPAAETIACATHADCRDDACPVGESICDFSGASGVEAGHCTTRPVRYADSSATTGEAADFGCWGAPQELVDEGRTTTVFGCVESFGLDVTTTIGLDLELWDAETFLAALAAGQARPAPLLTRTSVAVEDVFASASDCKYDGAYFLEGVPVGKKLVVRVGNAEDADFVDTWVFNFAVAAEELTTTLPPAVAATGATEGASLNVAAISNTTYSTIPPLAGLAAGVPSGKGVLAGEIGDCDDRVVANAKVSVNPAPLKFSYFNGQPDAKPDPRRRSSHVDGLYAALGLDAGPVTVNARVKTEDGELDLGTFEAAIFADAVTILSIRGKQRAADR